MAVESVPSIRGSIETHDSHNRFKKNVLDGAHIVPRTYSKCLEEELKDVKCSGTQYGTSTLWFLSLDSLDKYISIFSRRKVGHSEPSLSQYV
jgi:hypothetical protein